MLKIKRFLFLIFFLAYPATQASAGGGSCSVSDHGTAITKSTYEFATGAIGGKSFLGGIVGKSLGIVNGFLFDVATLTEQEGFVDQFNAGRQQIADVKKLKSEIDNPDNASFSGAMAVRQGLFTTKELEDLFK